MGHRALRGRDLHSPSSELIENNSGSTITALTCVKFNGQGTSYPQVIPCSGSSSNLLRGVLQTNIATGSVGYMTSFGFINAIDTSAWAPGTLLYADVSGNLSSSVLGSSVAQVLSQDAVNGILYVSRTGPAGPNGTAGPTGATGATGSPGSQIIVGASVPSSGTGVDSDFYIVSTNGDYYLKISGGWVFKGNLLGPVGPAGSTGPTGANGNTILNGVGAPGAIGVNGDFYIDTFAEEIYGPKTSGFWGSPTSLIGPTGPQGPAGSIGTLSGDVSGPGSATVVDFVGSSTAANVHTAELLANAATSSNTSNTIVKRDSNGDFSARFVNVAHVKASQDLQIEVDGSSALLIAKSYNTIPGFDNLGANFLGLSARGTKASPTDSQLDDAFVTLAGAGYGVMSPAGMISVAAAENWNVSAQGAYIAFSTTPIGSDVSALAEVMRITSTGSVGIGTSTPAERLSVIGNILASGTITGSNLSGTNTGDQTITLTGDVTGSGTGSFATTIANSAITNTKLANVANNTIKGNKSGISAAPSDLALSDVVEATSSVLTITNGSKAIVGTSNLSIQVALASTSQSGYLSSTDWNTFNSKQSSLSFGNLTDVGTDGITVTGGTGSVIGSGTSISQHVADATHNGYLSATDWTTFNSKQAAGNYIAALTGDVVANGPGSVSSTIQVNVISNAKLAQMAAHTFKGNNTGSTANVLDLTATQLTAELNNFVGDTGFGGTKGLVPAPSAGDAAASKFLKADGTWTTVSVPTLTVGSYNSQTPSADGSVITGGSIYFQSASITNPGMVSTSTQSFAGNKTFTGNISALNLSGTNTGDQTITLTGDVTGSGTGSFAATISNSAVTNTKLANMVNNTIKGNKSGISSVPSDLSLSDVVETTSSILTISNGSKAIVGASNLSIQVAQSSAGQSGYLSSTDWSTFNSKGSGTVTSVAVVTANGVSGSVATATTTPAITLTLGAITPSSIVASGTVSGSNLSGTNTGDQTITLTGDVTGSGTGSFATTVANSAITNVKMANMANNTVKGNTSGGTAAPSDLALSNVVEATSSVLTITNGSKVIVGASNLSIQVAQSSGSVSGYLSSTDWNTFNGKGVGSVTTVSIVTANGVSGSVATSTTTPAITLTLGAITPTSIVASGTISSSNLSGTNTGDVTLGTANGLSLVGQALSLALSSTSTTGALSSTDWNTFNNKQTAGNYLTALTGDATASGPGSSALTLATVNSNVGSFGSASSSLAVTANAKGLITALSSQAIQIIESQVTNLVSDLASKQSTTLTNTHILVGNGSNVATDVAVSGDLTLANTGAFTIPIGTVTDAKGALAGKPACTVVSTSNLTLSGLQTIDGVSTAVNSLVLATAQSTGSQNGPWVVQSGAWTRPTWYASGSTTQAFQFITTLIRLGTTYQGSTWRITSPGAVTIDTTATTWAGVPYALNSSTVTGIVPLANGGTGSSAPTGVTGTGNIVLSASPTLTGTITAAAANFSGAVSASNLSGTNTGDQTITLTGDITGSGTGSFVTTVAANAVSNSKLAQMPTNTIKGNNTGGTTNALDLTVSQVQTMLGTSGTNTGDVTLAAVGSSPNANAASLSGQVLNLQPASASFPGVVTTGTQTIAGAKTFSSQLTALSTVINGTGGNGFQEVQSQSSNPSTPSSGFRLFADATSRFSWKGTNGFVRTFDGITNTADRVYTLQDAAMTIAGTAATQGGTAQTSYATGDLLYASASNTLSKLGIGTAGQVLTVASGVPAWVSTSIRTVATTGNINASDSGNVILLNQSGAITLTMPTHVTGQIFMLKDISGTSQTNQVTIARNGGTGNFENVAASYVFQTNFGALRILDDGTNYWLI